MKERVSAQAFRIVDSDILSFVCFFFFFLGGGGAREC